MAYTLGRGWIEYLRVDNVQLENVLGLRFNVWTSIVLFVLAAGYFWWSQRTRPGREEGVYVDRRTVDAAAVDEAAGDEAVDEAAGEVTDDTPEDEEASEESPEA